MLRITRTTEKLAEAQWAITHWSSLNDLLVQYLSPAYANLFARPSVAADGAVEWYSELNGEPVPLLQLPADARARAESLLTQKLASVAELHQRLEQNGSASADVLQLLKLAGQQPASASVWVIEGQPVITAWPDSAPQAAAAATATAAAAGAVTARRLWWPWLLLAFLLAVLALFLLRGCLPTAPPEPAVTQPEPAATQPEPVVAKPEPAPEPPQPVIEKPAVKPPPPVKALCPVNRQKQQAPEVVIVFDASGSMAISMDATVEELQRWNEGYAPRNIEREPRRISLARTAANKLIDDVPKDMSISLVSAANCRSIAVSKPFSFQQRGALKKSVNRIEPEGKTALAEALTKAGALVDGVNRDAIILLITDGNETCGGDPCAVANRLKKAKPRLQVNVVDIMSTGAGNCIAENTGGGVFAVNNTRDFNKVVTEAMKEYIPEGCE